MTDTGNLDKMGDEIKEALSVDERPRGHSLLEVYKEVSRLSAMNFFMTEVTNKYPNLTLYTVKENLEELAFMLLNDGTVTDTLVANLLQIDTEDVDKKFEVWKVAKHQIIKEDTEDDM